MSSSEILLESKGIEKSFLSADKTINVLRGLDLTLSRGETLSIRGESGSGKTTFLNLLSGLEVPDQGEILWKGTRLGDFPSKTLAKERAQFIGVIFQAYYLIPELNALENILMAARLVRPIRDEDTKRARSLLERVGLKDRENHAPPQLSGGERQRVAIARALMNQPQVILADEPTGNLDEKTGESIMKLVLELCSEQSSAMVLVTHNPLFAAKVGRQLFLEHGHLHDKN